ncbi:MAG: ribosome hibernation-promoting factor, HPF/YfiA family [Haliscomenobacter sp.]
MKIDVQAPFSVSEPMQQLIEDKLGKLQLFFERIQDATVFLKDDVQRFHHKESRKVEIELSIPGNTLFAEDSAESFEKALSGAAEKMRRQLEKYKNQQEDIRKA